MAIRFSLRSLFLLSWIFVFAACGSSIRPSAAPVAPTPPPVDVWQRVQQAGTLVVGTSVDYPPFEYYNQNFTVDGFDIALMREIAKTLGVKVEFKDIAFDGLAAALAVNQIDVAIGAISAVPERAQTLDFSQVYYVGEDAVLATNSSMPPIRSYADLANFTIGVQKGSVYETILTEKLIDTGLTQSTDLFTYNDMERAIADLRQGLLDLVVLDLGPAQNFAQQEHVELVGQGLTRQRYAIALPKGATTMQVQINNALDALRQRSVILGLVSRYLNLKQNEVQPLPAVVPTKPVPVTVVVSTPVPTRAVPAPTVPAPTVPTPTVPTPTVAATVTASAMVTATLALTPTTAATVVTPTACIDAMAYVADLTYDDQNMTQPPIFTPGQAFQKGWRVRNIGSCAWDNSYSLAFVEGNGPASSMGGQTVVISGTVAPGATYDLYANLVAPATPGIYQGTWQMRNAQQTPFGERVWIGINVLELGTTPTPTR